MDFRETVTISSLVLRNVAGTFLSTITNTATAARTWTVQDKSYTLAGTDDTHAATSKTTPVDADELPLQDSAASFALAKLTLTNLKAFLKTYFDTMYPSYTGWNSVSDTWTYLSADAPTFGITIPTDGTTKYSVGMRIKLTQTTVKYFIVTAVTATTLTVYGGTDYTLTNAAISAISYSGIKAPFGFPLNPDKWSVVVTDTTVRSQASSVASTWYNLGAVQISIPIGTWQLSYKVAAYHTSANNDSDATTTLSTVNNTAGLTDFQVRHYTNAHTSGLGNDSFITHIANDVYTVVAKTSLFLNTMTVVGTGTLYNYNNSIIAKIKAVCAYL